jgi:hypothetical protein
MSKADQFERNELGPGDAYRQESGRNGSVRKDLGMHDPLPMPAPASSPVSSPTPGPTPVPSPRDPLPRTSGSPLPVGGRSPLATTQMEGPSPRPNVPPPGRGLSHSNAFEGEQSSGMQWAMGALKQAVPFIQRLLPLIDGNIATAVANLMSTRPHTPPPAPRVDLQPIETGLTELQNQHRDLRTQLLEQNTSLKKVEDQLEMVREATDRNTLEQQELIEDLKVVSSKVNLFALIVLSLLVISVLLNLFLFLHIQRVLP